MRGYTFDDGAFSLTDIKLHLPVPMEDGEEFDKYLKKNSYHQEGNYKDGFASVYRHDNGIHFYICISDDGYEFITTGLPNLVKLLRFFNIEWTQMNTCNYQRIVNQYDLITISTCNRILKLITFDDQALVECEYPIHTDSEQREMWRESQERRKKEKEKKENLVKQLEEAPK